MVQNDFPQLGNDKDLLAKDGDADPKNNYKLKWLVGSPDSLVGYDSNTLIEIVPKSTFALKQHSHAPAEIVTDADNRFISDAKLTDIATALSNSETAIGTANDAASKAVQASLDAAHAIETANGALALANDAKDIAVKVDGKAEKAITDSANAVTVANGIDAKATKALTDSATAKKTADNAVPNDAGYKSMAAAAWSGAGLGATASGLATELNLWRNNTVKPYMADNDGDISTLKTATSTLNTRVGTLEEHVTDWKPAIESLQKDMNALDDYNVVKVASFTSVDIASDKAAVLFNLKSRVRNMHGTFTLHLNVVVNHIESNASLRFEINDGWITDVQWLPTNRFCGVPYWTAGKIWLAMPKVNSGINITSADLYGASNWQCDDALKEQITLLPTLPLEVPKADTFGILFSGVQYAFTFGASMNDYSGNGFIYSRYEPVNLISGAKQTIKNLCYFTKVNVILKSDDKYLTFPVEIINDGVNATKKYTIQGKSYVGISTDIRTGTFFRTPPRKNPQEDWYTEGNSVTLDLCQTIATLDINAVSGDFTVNVSGSGYSLVKAIFE